MTYKQAEEYILSIPKFSSKNSMEDTKAFLRFLGNPDRELQIIHVAGTNGKGSVCAFLTSILCHAGYHVGTFVSPHLVTMRERFLLDGEMIGEEDFLEAFLQVKAALEAYTDGDNYHPSFFEYLFFMSMLIFQKNKVDCVVLETGLGGRLDATNSVEKKLATVITSIGYDHMEYLGDTLTAIAGEKAGIMRPGTPVIFSDKNEQVTEAILQAAKTVEALPIGVKKQDYSPKRNFRAGIDFSCFTNYYGYICLHADSAGTYQAENGALAIRTLEAIEYRIPRQTTGTGALEEREKGAANRDDSGKQCPMISLRDLQEGIQNARWEARMEQIRPGVFLDGAHNTDGMVAFLDSVFYTSPDRKRILLYSVVKDKQYEEVLAMLAKSKAFETIGIVAIHDARGLDPGEMERVLSSYEVPVTIYDSLDAAMQDTLEKVDKHGYTAYIAGSLYLAGEVKGIL